MLRRLVPSVCLLVNRMMTSARLRRMRRRHEVSAGVLLWKRELVLAGEAALSCTGYWSLGHGG